MGGVVGGGKVVGVEVVRGGMRLVEGRWLNYLFH